MKSGLLSFASAAALALLGAVLLAGPSESLHHLLHKHAVWPFDPCCCAPPGHASCAWSDHFGHPWSRHAKIAGAGKLAVIAGIGCLFLAIIASPTSGHRGGE
jgi:hypothetical protein